ncbi:MAG: hypothetical protein IT320_20840 [Anaerolineae bacterium]|nr:hypothetical protein [Anaerolineae bacterium]
MKHYAVNIADLYKDKAIQIMVWGVMDTNPDHAIMRAEGKELLDAIAAPLDCDVERSEAIIEVVRKRWHPRLLRFYVSESGHGGWKSV